MPINYIDERQFEDAPMASLDLASSDLLAALAKRTAQAQQQSNMAGQAYQAAASQPAQTLQQSNPAATSIATGLGRIAEGLGATGAPAQLRQTLDRRNSELAQRRLENLNALGKNYELLAKRAETLGDLESTTKYRSLSDKLAREQAKLIETQRAGHAMDEIRARSTQSERELGIQQTNELARITARGAQERATNAAKAKLEGTTGAASGAATPALLESVLTGQSKLTDFSQKERENIVSLADRTGQRIIPPKARDSLNALNAGKSAAKRLRALSLGINGKPGVNRASGAAAYGEGANALIGLAKKSRPDVRAYNAATKGFLATISRATGERGVLTDQDVGRARELIPGIFDSKEEAEAKLAQLEDLLTELDSRVIDTYTIRRATGGGMQPAHNDADPLGILGQ